MAQSQAQTLQDIIAQFATVSTTNAGTRAELTEQQGIINEAQVKLVDEIRRSAEVAAQAQTATGQLLLHQTDLNKQSQAEFGANREAQNYVLKSLSERSLKASEELTQSAADIAAQMQTGFSDNPLEWVVKQFTLPRQVRAHNAKVAEQKIIDDTITKVQQRANNAIAANAAIAATTSTEILALNAKKILSAAEIEVARATHETAKVNMNVISVRGTYDQKDFENLLNVNQVQSNERNYQLSLRQAALAEKSFNLSEQRFALDKAQEARAKAVYDNALLSDAILKPLLDKATATFNLAPITPEIYRQMQGPMKEKLQQAMMSPDVQEDRLGASPVVSVQNLDIMGTRLPPQQEKIKAKIQDIISTAPAEFTTSWATMKPEDRRREENKLVKKRVDEELKNIPDEGGFFSAPPLKSVGEIKGVAGTELWQKVMAPLAKDEFTPTKANSLLVFTAEAVAKGQISLAKAKEDYATIFRAIVADNHNQNNYAKFGLLIAPEKINSYTTRVDLPGRGIFGGVEVLEHTSAEQVGNALMRYVNSKRSELSMPRLGDVRKTPVITDLGGTRVRPTVPLGSSEGDIR